MASPRVGYAHQERKTGSARIPTQPSALWAARLGRVLWQRSAAVARAGRFDERSIQRWCRADESQASPLERAEYLLRDCLAAGIESSDLAAVVDPLCSVIGGRYSSSEQRGLSLGEAVAEIVEQGSAVAAGRLLGSEPLSADDQVEIETAATTLHQLADELMAAARRASGAGTPNAEEASGATLASRLTPGGPLAR